jgi:hypothetical protein
MGLTTTLRTLGLDHRARGYAVRPIDRRPLVISVGNLHGGGWKLPRSAHLPLHMTQSKMNPPLGYIHMSSQCDHPSSKQLNHEDYVGTGFEIFFEPKQEHAEMALLADLSGLLHSLNLMFQYKEFGNIHLFRTDAVPVTEHEREAVEDWLADRHDLVFFDVAHLSHAPNPCLARAMDKKATPKRVLLCIKPSIH